MIKECEAAGLPKPVYFYDMSGLFVEFKKDIYNEEYLMELGLNERQVKAVMYVKEKGEITNKEYLEIISISKRTATTAMTLTSCIGD